MVSHKIRRKKKHSRRTHKEKRRNNTKKRYRRKNKTRKLHRMKVMKGGTKQELIDRLLSYRQDAISTELGTRGATD